MSYESKLYFVKEYSFPQPMPYSHDIATINLSKIGYSEEATAFLNEFSEDTPFYLRVEGYNEEKNCECMVDTIEDKYGKRLKYAPDKHKLLKKAKELKKSDDYPMFGVLVKMIDAFKDFDNIYIVHYGY